MRDICLFAFLFRSHLSPKLHVFLRPIGARSKDRLLWTLKRSRENPSPSFFSLHMNFSTSSLYSVVFVVAFVFFSDCLASRALRFTRKPTKCRICCKQGYLLPCLLYSTHDSFLSVVFDANSCNLHLFSKLFSHKDYWLPGYWLECFLDFCGLYCSHSVLLQKLLTRWTYRKTGFNFSYFPREISWIRFRNLFFSACFRKSFFSKPTGYVPVFIC